MSAGDRAVRGRSVRRPDAEHGASAVEYALLVAFVAAVIFSAVLLLGQGLPALFDVSF